MKCNLFNHNKKRYLVGELLNELKEEIHPMIMMPDNEMYYTLPRIKSLKYDGDTQSYFFECHNGETYTLNTYE